MGYPMTYRRVVQRNRLTGDYLPAVGGKVDYIALIAGDLRRLEADSVDETQVAWRARRLGLAPDVVQAVLRDFLERDFLEIGPKEERGNGTNPDPWDALPEEIQDLVADYGNAREGDAHRYDTGGGISRSEAYAARTALAAALLPLLKDRERMDWLEKQLRDVGDRLPSGWSIGDVTLRACVDETRIKEAPDA